MKYIFSDLKSERLYNIFTVEDRSGAKGVCGGCDTPLSLFQSANWQLQSVKWWCASLDAKCVALHVYHLVSRH